MSEQVKHTPTPWVIRYGAVNDFDEGFGIASTIGDPRIVCECYPCGTTKELRQQLAADARFIVEAVNSHDTLKRQRDALRNALEQILAHVEDMSVKRDPPNQCTLCHTYRMIGHDALAAAKE